MTDRLRKIIVGHKELSNEPTGWIILNNKRKSNLQVRGRKRKRKNSDENNKFFKISYFTKHFPIVIDYQHPPQNMVLITNNIEENLLEKFPFETWSFKTFSYLEAVIAVENLIRSFENKHRALMPFQKSKKLDNKTNTLNSLEDTNMRLSEALKFCHCYKKSVLAKLFNVKVYQIYEVMKKEKENKAPILEKQGRKTIMKAEYLSFINDYLKNPNNCFTSLRNLKFLLMEQFLLTEEELSITTIHRMVKSLGFHYKRSRRVSIHRNTYDTKEVRYRLIMEILKHRYLQRKFIFLDETGFNNYLRPYYGYAHKKEHCIYKVGDKTKNFSVLAAISEDKILGYQIFKGSVTAKDYGSFLVNLINLCGIKDQGTDNYVFFVDNSKIHSAKVLHDLNSYLHVCFNAPYSPQLNPIEEVFGLWKSLFRKLRTFDEEDVVRNITISCQKIKTRHIVGFVKHSIEYYLDCLDKNEIN